MKKGFTLVELLIVIAILAVLATATVVVLNPAELLAQARDAQRISDMESLRTAVGIYMSQVSPIKMCESGACAATGRCSFSNTAGNAPFTGDCSNAAYAATLRAVDGTGWVDVKFTDISGGSPIPNLPIDPTQSGTYLYAYKGDYANKTFVLRTRLESVKHRGEMTSDGDPAGKSTCATYTENTCWYSVGTDPGLDL